MVAVAFKNGPGGWMEMLRADYTGLQSLRGNWLRCRGSAVMYRTDHRGAGVHAGRVYDYREN
jgi:hypothetical protein